MNYLSIGHNNNLDGCCWFYRNKLLVKENTSHSDWISNELRNTGFACGRFDKKKNLVSFVGYNISNSKKEFIKKKLLKRFDAKIVEC